MRCLHYPLCITRPWWPSVDAGLMDIVRMAPWPCHFLFSAYWVTIHWLWIAASKSLTNYRIYKTRNCGGSIDGWGVAALTWTILPIKAANTSIMSKCHSTALGLYKMQLPNHWHSVDTLLTRCWCSVDALLMVCWRSFWGVAVSTKTILPIQAANTSIMGICPSTALGLYMMQHPKSLTLCWRSFSDWGCDHVAISFVHNSCHYVDYR